MTSQDDGVRRAVAVEHACTRTKWVREGPRWQWYRQVLHADWTPSSDVKREIRSASILKDGRIVFNVAGNKYRIVVWINYRYGVVYVRFIGTHADDDRIDAQTV
jgi:mRNA interferase HigB